MLSVEEKKIRVKWYKLKVVTESTLEWETQKVPSKEKVLMREPKDKLMQLMGECMESTFHPEETVKANALRRELGIFKRWKNTSKAI